MSIHTKCTDSGFRYNVLKCIDLPSASLTCTVNWTGSSKNAKFPVSVCSTISKIIAENLLEVPDLGNPILIDLVVLPEIGGSIEWTGFIQDKDWSTANNTQITVEGSFRIYPAGIEYGNGEMKYKFTAECKNGTALF